MTKTAQEKKTLPKRTLREHQSVLVVGDVCTGKSTGILTQLIEVVAGKKDIGIPPRKALIVDVNDEYGVKDHNGKKIKVKSIAPKDIRKFAKSKVCEIRRVCPYDESGKRLSAKKLRDMVHEVYLDFRDSNGVLFLDSCNLYLSEQDMVDFFVRFRQLSFDIVLVLPSIPNFTPLLICCCVLKLHRTTKFLSFAYGEDDDYPNEVPEIIKIAQNIAFFATLDANEEKSTVLKGLAYNKYYSIYVDLENLKIRGEYLSSVVNLAIDSYIDESKTLDNRLSDADFRERVQEPFLGLIEVKYLIREELKEKYFVNENN